MGRKIKHIWFDFGDTLAFPDEEAHNKLRYDTYSKAVGRPVNPELIKEYESLFQKYKSNSGVFTSLGLDSGYWSRHFVIVKMHLAEPDIPEILKELREIVPISIWSNVRAKRMLPMLGIDPDLFTYILGPDEVRNPKPATDGFKLIIEKSNIEPESILFVGDHVQKEILPAKSLGIKTAIIWASSPEADYCLKSFRDIFPLVK